jgi:hypothetical protein
MARKTWVKIKRGLLIDPKHRLALGTNVWLYLYMLDVTDWDTGKIIDWHDQAAADDLMMPVGTVRYQRRKLEDANYISCQQLYQRQVITIKRWVNPREYGGKVYNTDGEEWDVDDNGSDELAPLSDDGDKHGVNDGAKHGVNGLTPLHINHISHITYQELRLSGDLFDDCRVVYERLKGNQIADAASFGIMITDFKSKGATAEDYYNAIKAQDAKGGYGEAPTSYHKWTIGYPEQRKNPPKLNGRTPRTPAEIAAHNAAVLDQLAEEY